MQYPHKLLFIEFINTPSLSLDYSTIKSIFSRFKRNVAVSIFTSLLDIVLLRSPRGLGRGDDINMQNKGFCVTVSPL